MNVLKKEEGQFQKKYIYKHVIMSIYWHIYHIHTSPGHEKASIGLVDLSKCTIDIIIMFLSLRWSKYKYGMTNLGSR